MTALRAAVERAHRAFVDDLTPRRRTELVAFGSFAVTVAATRGVTRLIRAGHGPFHDIDIGPVHVHHYLPGIALLTAAGGMGVRGSDALRAHCLLGAVFGAGTALVADELPLLVSLRDVYWTPEGAWRVRLTLTISALWGAGLAGAPIWRALVGRPAGGR